MEDRVAQHYTQGGLLEAIRDAFVAAGKDWHALTARDLVPVDQLHARGVEATKALASLFQVTPAMHLLDIGSGVGGPARWFADTFGCRVTGIDLTPEFVAVATALTEQVRMTDRVRFEVASALDLPFGDATFDGAVSQNVTMNIADKDGFFSEAFRVLKPDGFLALAEINQGPGGPAVYPTVWAQSAETSFLATTAETLAALERAGFAVETVRDNGADYKAWLARQRSQAADAGRPALGSHIVVGRDFKEKSRSSARNVEEDRVVPVDILCRKPAR